MEEPSTYLGRRTMHLAHIRFPGTVLRRPVRRSLMACSVFVAWQIQSQRAITGRGAHPESAMGDFGYRYQETGFSSSTRKSIGTNTATWPRRGKRLHSAAGSPAHRVRGPTGCQEHSSGHSQQVALAIGEQSQPMGPPQLSLAHHRVGRGLRGRGRGANKGPVRVPQNASGLRN